MVIPRRIYYMHSSMENGTTAMLNSEKVKSVALAIVKIL